MAVRLLIAIGLFTSLIALHPSQEPPAVIRINLLGYRPESPKAAVWGSLTEHSVSQFQLINAETNESVQSFSAGQSFGAYGPFAQTYRLNFSSFRKPGRYYIRADDGTRSARM